MQLSMADARSSGRSRLKALAAAVGLMLLPLAPANAQVFGQADGPVTVAEGVVKKGDLVVSYPVQALHTGVLVGDAKAGRNVFLQDGTPVYRASFVETLNGMGIAGGTVWCGVPPGADKGWCVLDVGHGLDVLVGMSTMFHSTPYSPDSYSTLSEHLSKPYPTVREQPVTFPVKLRQEISFWGWTHDGARLGVRIFDDAGRKSSLTSLTPPREADGSVVLPLRDGPIRLRQTGNGLTVEQVAPAKPAP